ncbi:GTP cyclohydrolase [Arachidicoccus ginsenosidimutans]|uniref:YciI family protein n=1 Tax=Arachidicoccus sp. BS20 TaxID=1850526 RepID=UPI0007F0F085|nr:YciI family protein [Arachidicoccus sp. BS20]ANI88641.1 GTP cyclohydrolase [Arachidicoccus sp. BS20]
MFIVSLTYKKPLEEVDKYIQPHSDFLDKQYQAKKFIFSGRKNPRTGGLIAAYNVTKAELENIITQDPFYQNGIADYEITEIIPTKYDNNFASFVTQS